MKTACQPPFRYSAPDAKKVRSYVEAWSARDLDGYLATFASDGTSSDPNLPEPTHAHGLKEHFAGFFAGFPDASCETVALDAISDNVWVWRFIIRGTNTGSLRGLPPTGRRVEVPGCEFIEVRGDRIRRVQGYIDRLTMLNQLGLAPSSPNNSDDITISGQKRSLSRQKSAELYVSLCLLLLNRSGTLEHRKVNQLSSAAEIASELEAFYKTYVDTVNREDIDALTDIFAFPWALVSGDGGLIVFNNETDHQSFLSKLIMDLKARGWARGGIDRFTAWAFADDLAMILTDFTRYRVDGSILDVGRACYTVRREGKNWKMLMISEVKPLFLGPGDLPR